MARSARRPEPDDETYSPLRAGGAALLRLIAREPVLVGGGTAFLVALSFVSANAIWYQPHAHRDAFFATRDFAAGKAWGDPEPRTTILLERPEPDKPAGDPVVKQVQAVLKDLRFYQGEIDGLSGPATRQAIGAYQTRVGLASTGTIDGRLLDELGIAPATTAGIPTPTPRSATVRDASIKVAAPAAPRQPDKRLMAIQRGLRAFGNEQIEVDGLAGSRTEAAIREFQSLFGLPETGQADDAVYAKMREIGLMD